MTDQLLTKSQFLDYRDCPKSLWLERHRPEHAVRSAPSAFDRLLLADGYAVEAQAKTLVASWPDADKCSFQDNFETDDGLLARADLVRRNEDGSLDLFEIKASASLKSSDGSDHVVDAAFQRIVAERAGHTVGKVHVMHVDKDYVRNGAVEPDELLVIEDVTQAVEELRPSLEREIEETIDFLKLPAIDEAGCTCRYKGNRQRHCVGFAYLNSDIEEPSAYLLPRISASKLRKFDEAGSLALRSISPTDLSKLQKPVWAAVTSGEPQVNRAAIASFLEELVWPLYFYDYETFGSAIPIADGHMPHAQMPVQFSLHVLEEDGTLTHHEYLAEQAGQQEQLVEALGSAIGAKGSLISWNMTFEKACNTRMAELLPHYAPFLLDINERTRDLMDVFKENYVHPGFEGSTSIKKVLPVLVPRLAYPEDAVHDGAGAILAWKEMCETSNREHAERLKRELLEYCELDSLAMVEIFRFLRALTH